MQREEWEEGNRDDLLEKFTNRQVQDDEDEDDHAWLEKKLAAMAIEVEGAISDQVRLVGMDQGQGEASSGMSKGPHRPAEHPVHGLLLTLVPDDTRLGGPTEGAA